jgi:hypothetical protein
MTAIRLITNCGALQQLHTATEFNVQSWPPTLQLAMSQYAAAGGCGWGLSVSNTREV